MEKRLIGHPARGPGVPKPVIAFVIGLVLVGVGSLVTGVGMDWVPVDESSVHAPRWVIAVLGAVFGFVGLLLLGGAVRGRRKLARRNRMLVERPGEPWLADHPWSSRGEVFTGARPFVQATGGTLFFTLFLLPFNWWAWFLPSDSLMVKGIVGAFDVVLALGFYHVGLKLLRWLRHGRCELVYESFPFSVGGEVALRFRRTGAAAFRRITFVFRCVEERLVETGSDSDSSTRFVCFARHEEERVLEEWDGAAAPGKDVPLRFEVPADAPGTKLADNPPTYWELTVHGETGGPDLAATFLVPVYSA